MLTKRLRTQLVVVRQFSCIVSDFCQSLTQQQFELDTFDRQKPIETKITSRCFLMKTIVLRTFDTAPYHVL